MTEWTHRVKDKVLRELPRRAIMVLVFAGVITGMGAVLHALEGKGGPVLAGLKRVLDHFVFGWP